MTIPAVTENPQSLIIPFLYLSSGYISLLMGYWFTSDTKFFYETMKGTDKLILTFIIGTFSLLTARGFFGTSSELNYQTLPSFVIFLSLLSVLLGFLIAIIRRISSRNKN